jgi:peptide/nickel transport system ATP-binding protein
MSDQIAIMYLGRFVEVGPAEEVFSNPRHPYTRLLLETIPNVEAPIRDRRPMSGEVPSPIAPPPGCPFHPRCPMAEPRCSVERPVLRGDGRQTACHLV